MSGVFVDPADPRGRQKYRLRPHFGKPAIDRRLIAQVEGFAAGGQDFAILLSQAAHQRRADHAAVTGDKHPSSRERKDDRHRLSRLPPPRRRARDR